MFICPTIVAAWPTVLLINKFPGCFENFCQIDKIIHIIVTADPRYIPMANTTTGT